MAPHAKKSKPKQAQGVVTKCTSRVAKSGSQAHSFYLGEQKYTIFMDDELSPVTEGDRVTFFYEERTLKSKYHNRYNAVVADTLVLTAPAGLCEEVEGTVYVLSNPSMKGLLKIGYTTGTATKRAEELSNVTGVPTGFKVEWSLPIIGSPRMVEQSVHAHLAHCRHGKEFFKVGLAEARDACITSFAKLYPEQAALMDTAFSERAANELLRRERLNVLASEKAEKVKAEIAEKTYEQSREGKWRNQGECKITLKKFSTEPNRNYPSLLGKILGQKYEDFIEVTIFARQPKDEIDWLVTFRGRKNEKSIYESSSFPTYEVSLENVSSILEMYQIGNQQVQIQIPNILIENVPPLPDDIMNYRFTLEP